MQLGLESRPTRVKREMDVSQISILSCAENQARQTSAENPKRSIVKHIDACRMGVLYSARRAASAADLNGGAWNVGGEASGEWRAASE